LIYDGKLHLDKNHPVPERKPFEVLIRVLKAGICRTDVEITRGYLAFKGILGHEFVGVVEGSPDKGLIGKRVVGEINIACGSCFYCVQRLVSHCENRGVLGICNKNGAFAEYVTLPIENVHVLPDSIADDEAIFVEPLAAAAQILQQVHVRPEDNVIVLGDGKLGLLCAQVMAFTGAQVLAVGKHPDKLQILKERGIRTCLKEELGRERADIVVEATGAAAGLTQALASVHPRGTIILKSTYAEKAKIDLAPLVINEVTVVGSRCGPFSTAIRLLETKAVNVLPFITHRFSLAEGVEALDEARKGRCLKVVLEIHPGRLTE
jgi:2-desacetyl-2-hydroxyethyl bacteriochlorophyllide A dehydrogenase